MHVLNKLLNGIQRRYFRPGISVIVPVYNNCQYLDECLGSIIGQTLKNIEIIVVNDGSTDPGVGERLNYFSRLDKRIAVITKANTGYGASMNVGIRAARGKYIGIVESDDFIRPAMYATLYKYTDNDPDIVKGNGLFFKGDKQQRLFKETRVMRLNKSKVIKNADKNEFFRGIGLNQLGIFRRKFILENKISFSETPGASFQDIGFFLLTAMHAQKINVINQPLYCVRRDNENSSVYSKGKMEAPVYEYARIEKYLENNPGLKKTYLRFVYLRKFLSYRFTLLRLGDSYREKFKKIFREEWLEACAKNRIDFNLFHADELEWLEKNILMAERQ